MLFPQLFSYVVCYDIGFAPNPFHGWCSLACCKPRIRQKAEIGDFIVGTTSKVYANPPRFLYAMEITEILDFNTYWSDPRFEIKRPNIYGSKKIIFGDNVYHQNSKNGEWIQEDSRHSNLNGDLHEQHLFRDTNTTTNVLLSNNFSYWGSNSMPIPSNFRQNGIGGEDIVKEGQGHKKNFSHDFVDSFITWFKQQDRGVHGRPFDWTEKKMII